MPKSLSRIHFGVVGHCKVLFAQAAVLVAVGRGDPQFRSAHGGRGRESPRHAVRTAYAERGQMYELERL